MNTRSGHCFIDDHDMLRLAACMTSFNPILMIAASKGCPADGVLYPKPVEGVTYTRINHCDGRIEIRWKETETEK